VTRSDLADAFGHHVWATLTLIDACRQLDSNQLSTAVPGTYGSILDTMRHTVGADSGYLSVLTRGRLARIDEDSMDLDRLRAVMVTNGPAWAALLDEHPDPAEVLTRHRDDGAATGAPIGIRLAQAIHHGTDHRSQICTALTILGIEPPDIDVWRYAEVEGVLTETPPLS